MAERIMRYRKPADAWCDALPLGNGRLGAMAYGHTRVERIQLNEDSESRSWRRRKQAAIDRLAGASREAKMVALGDKLSNMRAIARDYRVKGDALWHIFHAPGGRADHA